jgi:DNA-binding CsgD family transcriptional regulator/tetratricopeptide (TPR) repeat protein
LRSALVGRDAELESLRRLYAGVCAGVPAGAVIVGEAGVGKSRLLEEFTAIASSAGATISHATCFEFGSAPLAPLIEAFDALGLSVLSDVSARDGITTAEAHAAKHRLFSDGMRALTERASLAPTVIVVDDLQWADFATLEFLAFFARFKGSAPLLFLCAVRSEAVEHDHVRADAIHKLQKDGLTQLLALQPLSDADMRRLIANIWPGDVPAESAQVDRICALAEGKPYFAEELVAGSVRSGTAAPSPSIRAGVLSRFAQLPDEDQRIVTYASVIGRRFDVSLLSKLCGISFAHALESMARACSLQLISEVAPEGELFAFRHAVTREVIYGELLAAQARAIHRDIAELLSRDERVADAAELAYHWSSCGNDEKAAVSFERAGDLATSRSAYADAARAYAEATNHRALDHLTAELCEKLSRALSIKGDVNSACEWYQQAVDTYVADAKFDLALPLALKLSRRYYEAAQPEKAVEVVEWILRLLDEGRLNDDAAAANIRFEAHVSKASFEGLQGRTQSAFAEISRTESIAGTRPLELRHAFLLTRAMLRATSLQLGLAFVDYEEAVVLARAIGDDERLVWTLNNYGSRASVAGRVDAGITALREAFEVSSRCNYRKMAALAIQSLALAYLLAGDLKACASAQRQGADVSAGFPLAQTIASAVAVRLAMLARDRADNDRSTDVETLETAFRTGETQNIGLLSGCVAAYFDVLGRTKDAERVRSRALPYVHSVDFSFWLLDQLATSGDAREVAQARSLLAAAARDPDHILAHAHLALFNARAAVCDGSRTVAKPLAIRAAELFSAANLPWERAQALELAGLHARALEIYQNHGYLRDHARLSRARRRLRHRPSRLELTEREEEIVRLAVAGESNRAIAQALQIGERTVETHVAAVFDRFDLTSRSQLASVLPADDATTKSNV